MQRQLVAAGDRRALHDGDDRERPRLDAVEQHLDVLVLAEVAAQVEPGAEHPALGADDGDPLRRTGPG